MADLPPIFSNPARRAHDGRLQELGERHAGILQASLAAHGRAFAERASSIAAATGERDVAADLAGYLVDAAQRWVLYWDVLRQRGDNYLAHEAAGAPPVLGFRYETVVDGRALPRRSNYAMVRILPDDGARPDPRRRPYLIIDPRAGQAAGIGGSKAESQVGVALKTGHPVYFAIFFPHPEPGQTLADVCATHAHFVRAVRALHPDAPRPIVVGNCQGGWATALLAASNPDVTGPIVINGAPLAYWSGARARRHPMRYLGGLTGGAVPAMLMSDLGNGEFDGAHLVLNFESFSPANVWWRKYYDLYAGVDEPSRYLEFEKWWGGFMFMTEAEIRWIVKNLFIGNRLARQGVHLDSQTFVDLRNIRSPIIVFASYGDDITPPQQALNWIADLYREVQEIRIKGQRIIYCLHKDVGHLGIFVSSKVAKEQHSEIVSTMKTIEALPPGLYEMVIEDKAGTGVHATFTVSFQPRSIDDVQALNDHREDEAAFGAVARLSDLGENAYDLFVRPWVRAVVTPQSAQALVQMHPLRVRRWGASSRNPLLAPVAPLAERVRAERRPAAEDNPFVAWERLWAEMVEEGLNLARDARHAWLEIAFFSIYGQPGLQHLAESDLGVPLARGERNLRDVPEVQLALARIDQGGFADAVIRMMILMAKSRGAIRRSRLERSNRMLRTEEPFASLSAEARSRIIHEQSIVCDFEPDAALAALPLLLPERAERERALALVLDVAGDVAEMVPETLALIARLRRLLVHDDDARVPA